VTETTRTFSYDEVPYPSLSYTQSHPDRLATVATLLGLDPPPVARCRVLELGCASGGNLLPMAYGLSDSEFVGIDVSARQIAQGRQVIESLGLRNARLIQLDIMDADASLGTFDYVIAHGVFSWVRRPVQEKLLSLCQELLAANGVAYISYNAYPGWRMLGIIRDMMLYHTRATADPAQRAARARELLDFLAEAVPPDQSAYGSFLHMYARLLQGELKGANRRGDAFLLHDELEEINEPIYFWQFAERAQRHGLQYLGEAEFRTMVDRNFPPEVSACLREMSTSAIELEQYMDFLRNRTFRQTLLCHQGIELCHTLRPDQLRAFTIASRARLVAPEARLDDRSVVQFRASDGATLSTDHPATKTAMVHLAQIWPRGLRLAALLSEARSRLPPSAREEDPDQDTLVLGTNLLKAYTYSGNLIELHVHEPHMTTQVTERPVASPVARLQARRSEKVTNLRHERVDLDPIDRVLLPHMDGAHDLDALAAALEEGGAQAAEDGALIEDPDQTRRILRAGIERRLHWLARAALLVG